MKTVFEIGDGSKRGDQLLLELGQDYCCYAVLDKKEKTFRLIKYFSFDVFHSKEALENILKELRDDFDRVIISPAYPQALLLPEKYASGNYQLLSTFYGLADQKKMSDAIPEWQMVTHYALPSDEYNLLAGNFSSMDFFHAYTASLKMYNGFVAPDQFDINFSLQNFRVIVKKDQQLQLVQTYAYKTPLDVVYFLVKICGEFKMDQSEIFLIISGLVEEDSALYKELHHYFSNIHFAQAASYTLPESPHPHYYFHSLYNLAACVL